SVRCLQPDLHPPLVRGLLPAGGKPPLLPLPRRRLRRPHGRAGGRAAPAPIAPDHAPARWRHAGRGRGGAVMAMPIRPDGGDHRAPIGRIESYGGTAPSVAGLSEQGVQSTPGQQAVVMAALAIGLLLMGIQLWLLTVAL